MLGQLRNQWREQLLKEWREARGTNPAWLMALPAVLCLADLAATLRGQPAAYWRGDYSQVIEGNPVGWVALQLHPGAFFVGGLVWLTCFSAFIRWAPRRWSLTACLALIVSHTLGTCSWLPRIVPWWFLVGSVLCLITAALAVPTWRAWRGAWPSHPTPSSLRQDQVS